MPVPCLKYPSPSSCMSDPCSPFGSSCPVAFSGCPKVFPSLASRMHPPCSSLAQWCLVQCLAQCACQVTACWEMNEWTSTWNEENRHTCLKITWFFHWIFFFLSCSQIWSFPSLLVSVVCYKIFYDKQWPLLMHTFKNSVQEFRT